MHILFSRDDNGVLPAADSSQLMRYFLSGQKNWLGLTGNAVKEGLDGRLVNEFSLLTLNDLIQVHEFFSSGAPNQFKHLVILHCSRSELEAAVAFTTPVKYGSLAQGELTEQLLSEPRTPESSVDTAKLAGTPEKHFDIRKRTRTREQISIEALAAMARKGNTVKFGRHELAGTDSATTNTAALANQFRAKL